MTRRPSQSYPRPLSPSILTHRTLDTPTTYRAFDTPTTRWSFRRAYTLRS